MTPKKHWESVGSCPTNSPATKGIQSIAVSKYTNYQALVNIIRGRKDLILTSESEGRKLVSLLFKILNHTEKVQNLIGRWLISTGQYSVNLIHPGIIPITVDFMQKEGIWI